MCTWCVHLYICVCWKSLLLCFSDISVADFSRTTCQMTAKSYTHPQEGKSQQENSWLWLPHLCETQQASPSKSLPDWLIKEMLSHFHWFTGISAWALLLLFSRSVVSSFLQPHGLQTASFLCSWDSPGKNTRVGSHALFQGIFPTQGSNPGLLNWQVGSLPLSHQGSLHGH